MRLLVLLLLLAPLAAAQPDSTAPGYDYPLVIEDPEGDHEGIANGPNAGNPENDLIRFEATDDGSFFVMRITMGTCTFAVNNGGLTISAQIIGPNGEDWEATLEGSDGCVVDGFGQDYGPAGGDSDAPIPGLSAIGAPDENAYYMFVDMAAAGLKLGDELTFTSVGTGRLVRGGISLTFTGVDEFDISGTTYALNDNAVKAVAPASTLSFEDDDAFPLVREYQVVGNESYMINWTSDVSAVELVYAINGSGSVEFSLVDGTNRTLLRNTLIGDDNSTQVFRNTTAGVWNISVNFVGFNGTFAMELREAPEEVEEVEEEPGTEPGPEQSEGPEAEPSESESSTPDTQDSPFVGVALLVVGLALLAARRRA